MKKILIILGIIIIIGAIAYGSKDTVQENTQITQTPETIQIYDIEEGYLTVSAIPEAKQHTYNWENLKQENGFLQYEDEHYTTQLGIDVSTFQGEIDWQTVKQQGIEFAILRIGFRGYGQSGKLVLDERYKENITQATQAGIKVGVYFFSQAINEQEAKEEAQFVLDNVKDYAIDYPICYDLEKIKYDETARANGLSKEQRTKNAIAFCEEIKANGYQPMIYANAKWLTTELELAKLQNYGIWYADYQEKPIYPYQFTMWQYTESAQIEGIGGNVDCNIYFQKKD